jgi:hypothetical protein
MFALNPYKILAILALAALAVTMVVSLLRKLGWTR